MTEATVLGKQQRRATRPSIHFLCGKCESRNGRLSGDGPAACEHCGAPSEAIAPPAGSAVERCAVCGHEELYFQKDFNRNTGIAIVVVGSIFVPWTWGLSLLAVTILDYVVWRLVDDVVVCYDCQSVHRGYAAGPAVKPFDLVIHDRHVYGAAPPGAEEGHREE